MPVHPELPCDNSSSQPALEGSGSKRRIKAVYMISESQGQGGSVKS